jgi:hypothetical protein
LRYCRITEEMFAEKVRVFTASRAGTVLLVMALAVLTFSAWSSSAELFRSGRPTMITNPADFRAFYCASRTLTDGHDPYRTEPLRSCEHAAARGFGLRMFDGLVLPAPLPPYALVLFAPLARLDFHIASPLWLGFSLVAFAVSALFVARLARWPVAVTTLALLGPLAYVSLPLGQVMPVVVALICGAALAVRSRRFPVAAVLCAVATLEPHVALPACVALFAFSARTRLTFLACALCALGASLWFAGPAIVAEYVFRVIPLHALSQVDQFEVQFSLTAALRVLGASTSQALVAGSVSYVVLVTIGIAVARRLARDFRDDAFLILVPPAFALVGGTFVHLAQIAVAVPALVLLTSYLASASYARNFALAAVVALAIPWATIAETPGLAGAIWLHRVPPRAVILRPLPSVIAEETETMFIHGGGYGSNGGPLELVAGLKVPTWFGLICFCALAIRGSRRLDAHAS